MVRSRGLVRLTVGAVGIVTVAFAFTVPISLSAGNFVLLELAMALFLDVALAITLTDKGGGGAVKLAIHDASMEQRQHDVTVKLSAIRNAMRVPSKGGLGGAYSCRCYRMSLAQII